MNTENMTVHKALAELKTLDSRIQNAITSGSFICANKHSNEKINGKTISETTEKFKADYNRVNDLINRRNALKRAVVLSNALTKVTINNEEVTVAEAIEMKNHGLDYLMTFWTKATQSYRAATSVLEANSGEALERKAEQFILNTIQAQPKEMKMGVDNDVMQALRKDYIKNNTYDLINPLNLEEKLDALKDYIDTFRAEVDAALSVSNAVTVITIEY